MFDVEQRRRISVEELRDLLVGGENIDAETEETGRDCTMEVLRRVMSNGSLDPMSGQAGLAVPGLATLGTFGHLVGLLQVAGDRVDSYDDRRRDDRRDEPWDDRPRRARHRGRSGDWAAEFTAPDGDSG